MYGQTDTWMDGWIDVRTDGWIHGWMDGWMDGSGLKQQLMTAEAGAVDRNYFRILQLVYSRLWCNRFHLYIAIHSHFITVDYTLQFSHCEKNDLFVCVRSYFTSNLLLKSELLRLIK